jgi:hypothetical protein
MLILNIIFYSENQQSIQIKIFKQGTMKVTTFPIFLIFSILIIPHTSYSESNNSLQLIQHDIAELMMQKYTIKVDEKDFITYYRLSTLESVGEGSSEDYDGKITSMEINHERTSLVIKLNNIKQSDILSIRLPHDLISAEKGKFTILANGKERGYEWSVQGEFRNLIFIVPKQTTEVEIIGTKVIPEFTSEILVLVIVSSGLLITQRLYKKLG